MIAKKCSILLADDDEDDRFLFSEALKSDNPEMKIEMFENGNDLINYIFQNVHEPDMIFMDLNMPMMNGDELLEKLKKDPKTKKIPVIIYSTSYNQNIAQKLKKNGARFFLQKPSTFSDLKTKLNECVDLAMNTPNSNEDDLESFIL